MNHVRLQNGDLMFWLTQPEEIEALEVCIERGGYADHDWFGSYFCNEEFEFVYPEEIGALTGDSNPIFGIVTRDDDGELIDVHELWAYDYYQLRYAIEDLMRNGYVIFQNIPEVE